MLDITIWLIVFIVSLVVLIKSADFFTSAAERIGLHFGIPEFIVGVTIVSIGTSLPELVSSLVAVAHGSSEIVSGTVVGSNISNIFLVLGAAAILSKKKIKVSHNLINVDLPVLMASAFFITFMMWDGIFSFGEGIICIVGITLYIYYTTTVKDETINKEMFDKKKGNLGWKDPVFVVLGGFFIYFGAKYVIESVIQLSTILGLGTEVIAVSAVALGTSLPELTVSVVAARKGNASIAVGNVLGSNIFNSFAVMGIPALFGAILVPSNIIMFSIPVMIAATLLFFFITQDREVTKWEGAFLLLFYVFFIGKLFGLV